MNKFSPDNQRALLARAGEALYGDFWQSQLARAIGISDRTMRRWIADPHDIPDGVWNDIVEALLQRGVEIEALRHEITRARIGTSAD